MRDKGLAFERRAADYLHDHGVQILTSKLYRTHR